MKPLEFRFWDFLVAGLLLVLGLRLGGIAILLAVIAFFLYLAVRIQITAATRDATPFSGYIPAPDTTADDVTLPDDKASIQKQLVQANLEAQNAWADFRRYSSPYYERQWAAAVDKYKRLEAELSKLKFKT